MLKEGFNDLWPTKVFLGQINDKELLDNLIQEIFIIKNDIVGGISDTENIFSLNNKTIQKFKNEIVVPCFENYLQEVFNVSLKEYPDFTMRSWITGQSEGYGMPIHNHSTSPVSSVFYLMAEEVSSGGEIIFVDPRFNSNRGYDLNFKKAFSNEGHVPKSGEFLIFPSFLYHWVSYYHSKLRIAMPVDIFMGPEDSIDTKLK